MPLVPVNGYEDAWSNNITLLLLSMLVAKEDGEIHFSQTDYFEFINEYPEGQYKLVLIPKLETDTWEARLEPITAEEGLRVGVTYVVLDDPELGGLDAEEISIQDQT